MRLPTEVHGCARARVFAAAAAAIATLTVFSAAMAHDFWLIPDFFGFPDGSIVHVNARSGTGFPMGTAMQPTRVAEARIIGANSDVKITEMAIEGTALRLHHKPASPGQYLVTAILTPPPRINRVPPGGLIRFLRAEGGAAEATRLERDNTFMSRDTVLYASRSSAATVLQLGNGGPRAFSKTSGYPLEFVPLSDPATLRVGDTLHVRILGNGKPAANVGIDAVPAADTSSRAESSENQAVSLSADASGVVHVPLTKVGPWMIRSAFVSARPGGAANEFEVARATYTLSVKPR